MLTERAYAKINLFLDVLGRRPDGYHDLHTCMQTVSLCDTVTAEITDGAGTEIRLTCDLPGLAADESNLACRAAALYLKEAGITDTRICMHIEKRIPLSAGLAGGSADAAAVLRLLNRHYGERFSPDQLCAMGAMLGADVPFCVRGGTCRCEGIGERLTPVPVHGGYAVVIAKAAEGVSTPEAFRRLDELYGDFKKRPVRDAASLYDALAGGDILRLAAHMYNGFEEVILPLRPTAAALKESMRAGGAVTAMMSGSGPSVFGIFADVSAAEACADGIRANGIFAAVCRPTGGSL